MPECDLSTRGLEPARATALVERLEHRSLMSAVIGTGTGLQGEYYNTSNLTDLAVTRVDPTVNFNWSRTAPDPSIAKNIFSVRWQGEIEAEYSQTYTFRTTANDGVRLWVNGQLLIDHWTDHAVRQNQGKITLQAGEQYSIEMDYYEDSGRSVAKLSWSSPGHQNQIIPSSQLYPPADTSTGSGNSVGTTPATPPDPTTGGSSSNAGAGTGSSGTGSTVPPTVAPPTVTPPNPVPPTTAPPASGSTGTSSSTDVPPVAGNWTSIFDDEFTGNSLSPSWTNQMWNQTWNGTATVSNGTLALSAPNANTPALLNTQDSAQPFSFTYGYAQVTMQVPKGQGVWPAFWLLPLQSADHDQRGGEIDVFEGQGNLPNTAFATYVWNNPSQHLQTIDNTGTDLSAGYHTYGVDWEKNQITWYLDGKPIQTITSAQAPIDPNPMYLILDVWFGGWNGPTDSTTPFPATLNVKSVQVWQNSGT